MTGDSGDPTRIDGAVILVVEDDPHIADLLDLYLRQDGHRPYLAGSGERALGLFAERTPELVLLDLGLPGGIDGLEACRRIRATSDVPIIMITARDDEVDRIVGFELGADDYVIKPFSPRELMGRVRAVLRRSANTQTPTGSVSNSVVSASTANASRPRWMVSWLYWPPASSPCCGSSSNTPVEP